MQGLMTTLMLVPLTKFAAMFAKRMVGNGTWFDNKRTWSWNFAENETLGD